MQKLPPCGLLHPNPNRFPNTESGTTHKTITSNTNSRPQAHLKFNVSLWRPTSKLHFGNRETLRAPFKSSAVLFKAVASTPKHAAGTSENMLQVPSETYYSDSSKLAAGSTKPASAPSTHAALPGNTLWRLGSRGISPGVPLGGTHLNSSESAFTNSNHLVARLRWLPHLRTP